MAEEFKIIETQEQLDAVIKGRLEREQKKYSESTAGLQSEIDALKSTNAELSEKIKTYDEKYAGIDEKISSYESQIAKYKTDLVKTEIAKEFGIPYEMRDRLRGETEEELKADAEMFKKLMPQGSVTIPKSTEVVPTTENDNERAMRDMLKNL